MINSSLSQLIFLLLTPVSHIGASLFLVKPRFSKAVTAVIWLLYAALMLLLPPSTPTQNFFISLAVHLILFFATTKGRREEKGFLFLSYACIYTCTSTMLSVLHPRIQSEAFKILCAILLFMLMQGILYGLLLPAFKKVAPYIRSGWAQFYAVVISYLVLVVTQSVFPIMSPMTTKEIVIFVSTTVSFCIAYIAVFSNMKNTMELAREKRRQTHAELLLSQVQSQAKEAELVRQNRHDMRHHYQQLLAYANSGEIDKIKDYLERQTERIENITSGRFCENETVNNILRVYSQKAADHSIDMQIRAAAKRNLSPAVPDLVAIIANVLENALHGAQQSGSAKPFIRVTIRHKAQRFVISCENACSPALEFEEMPEYLRGVGIHSITATADQYGGSCLFCAKDGVFRCTVIMDE